MKEKKVDVALPSTSKGTHAKKGVVKTVIRKINAENISKTIREETQVKEEPDDDGDVEVEIIETSENLTCTKLALHDLEDLEKVDAANKKAEEYEMKLNEALEKLRKAEEKSVVDEANISDMEAAKQTMISEVMDLRLDLKGLT